MTTTSPHTICIAFFFILFLLSSVSGKTDSCQLLYATPTAATDDLSSNCSTPSTACSLPTLFAHLSSHCDVFGFDVGCFEVFFLGGGDDYLVDDENRVEFHACLNSSREITSKEIAEQRYALYLRGDDSLSSLVRFTRKEMPGSGVESSSPSPLFSFSGTVDGIVTGVEFVDFRDRPVAGVGIREPEPLYYEVPDVVVGPDVRFEENSTAWFGFLNQGTWRSCKEMANGIWPDPTNMLLEKNEVLPTSLSFGHGIDVQLDNRCFGILYDLNSSVGPQDCNGGCKLNVKGYYDVQIANGTFSNDSSLTISSWSDESPYKQTRSIRLSHLVYQYSDTLRIGPGVTGRIELEDVKIAHCGNQGGMQVLGTGSEDVFLTDVDFSSNINSVGAGGAISFNMVESVTELGRLTVVTSRDIVFHGNAAALSGGAIYFGPNYTVEALTTEWSNVAFQDNQAGALGGAMFFETAEATWGGPLATFEDNTQETGPSVLGMPWRLTYGTSERYSVVCQCDWYVDHPVPPCECPIANIRLQDNILGEWWQTDFPHVLDQQIWFSITKYGALVFKAVEVLPDPGKQYWNATFPKYDFCPCAEGAYPLDVCVSFDGQIGKCEFIVFDCPPKPKPKPHPKPKPEGLSTADVVIIVVVSLSGLVFLGAVIAALVILLRILRNRLRKRMEYVKIQRD